MITADINFLYEKIGAIIKSERIKKGISQEEFAEYLDLTRASIINLEKGRHKAALHQIIIIANVLGIDYFALLPRIGVSSFIKDFTQSVDIKNAILDDQSINNENTKQLIEVFTNTK